MRGTQSSVMGVKARPCDLMEEVPEGLAPEIAEIVMMDRYQNERITACCFRGIAPTDFGYQNWTTE